MELILDFLDGSVSKTFLVPLKSTSFTALRIIYFKIGLDIHADELTEFALALSPQKFEWKNIFWIESNLNLSDITQNGFKHVLLLKKHFIINDDIQIAKSNLLLSSLLYNQFSKIFLSLNINIEENILISLSARLLQSEFYGCEITSQFLCLDKRLLSILPAFFLEESLLVIKIFHFWEKFDSLCERDSRLAFVTTFLSFPLLYSYYSYDIFYGQEAVLTIFTNELIFTFASLIDVEIYPTNIICSLSFSIEKQCIILLFIYGSVLFLSDFVLQIVSIISSFLDVHIVCLDDSNTDVDQIQLSLENVLLLNFHLTLTDYLNILLQEIPFFEKIGFNFLQSTQLPNSIGQMGNLDCSKEFSSDIVLDVPYSSISDELSSLNECNFSSERGLLESSNFCESFDPDANYDFLELPQCISLFSLQNQNFNSLDYCSQLFSSKSLNDETFVNLDENDYSLIDEMNNPIYQDLHDTFPVHSIENFEHLSSPVCYDAISNKSTISPFLNLTFRDFNELGDTYNCAFETGVKSDNKFNGNSSDKVVLSNEQWNSLHDYFDYPVSSKYFFLFYVLLPNYDIYSELVDIRSKGESLLFNLGFPIGFWKDYYIYFLGCPLVFLDDPKRTDDVKLLNSSIPETGCEKFRKILELEISFISQNIYGSTIFQIVRKSDVIPDKVDFHPHSNSDQHYLRCCYSIIHCNTPITLQQAIDFASLQYKGYYFHRVSYKKSEYCSPWYFIPDDYKSIRGISKQIYQEQENLKLYNFSMVRDALIHQYMNLPQSGYIFFSAKEIRKKKLRHPKLVPIYFGISTAGLMTIHPISKRILSSYDFSALKSWKYTREAFIYKIGFNDELTAIQTNQGFCISTIVSYFIEGFLISAPREAIRVSKQPSLPINSLSTLGIQNSDFDNVYESI